MATMLWGEWGGRHGPQYVDRLWRASADYGFDRFVVWTDRSVGIRPRPRLECRTIPAPPSWKWNLRKMSAYAPVEQSGIERGEQVLLCDLDIAIVDDPSVLLRQQGELITIRDFYNSAKGAGGSITMFTASGELTEALWQPLMEKSAHFNSITNGSERRYLQMQIKPRTLYWQDLIPGAVVSFKPNRRRPWLEQLPCGAKIVAFHGKPRPHEVSVKTYPWLAEYRWGFDI